MSLSKNFTRHFFRIHPGGNRTLNRTVGFKKKIPSKFFGYLRSTVVSWILSLSKNVNRVLPRTHPGGGTRTLNGTLEFNKKFPLKFFGYV